MIARGIDDSWWLLVPAVRSCVYSIEKMSYKAKSRFIFFVSFRVHPELIQRLSQLDKIALFIASL
jgi:hypothetical protein